MAGKSLLPLLFACGGVAFGGTALALSASGELEVVVQLAQRCVNLSLGERTQARVEVSCSSGAFVNIEPQPGKPFLGTHGGAHRFHFSADSALPAGLAMARADPHLGAGTITSLRIYNIQGDSGPVEMLVSF